MGTTGYQAGVEANDVQLSYAKESVWKTLPATAFKALRMTGEGLRGQKQRQRPNEIRTDAQASAAVTMQESAGGNLNFALSYGTYDDVIESWLNSAWGADLAISSSAIAADGATEKFTGAAGTFNSVAVGQWIKVAGFSNAANNGYHRVTAKAGDGSDITVATNLTTEAAGAAVTIAGSTIHNSNVFQSLFIQKKLSASMFLRYPGAFITGGVVQAQQGQFAQGNFTWACGDEVKDITDASTGAIVAAPTGKVIDTVAGFARLELDGAPIDAVVRAVNINVTKEGAGQTYGISSAAAQGMIMGTFTLAGSVEIYFKDFTLYDAYKAESDHVIAYRQVDSSGNAYMVTIPAATLMNPTVNAGGPNQPVIAAFELEGNPHPTLGYTFQMDRFAA